MSINNYISNHVPHCPSCGYVEWVRYQTISVHTHVNGKVDRFPQLARFECVGCGDVPEVDSWLNYQLTNLFSERDGGDE